MRITPKVQKPKTALVHILASQQLDQPAKALSLKWAGEDVEVIINWVIVNFAISIIKTAAKLLWLELKS